MRFGGRSLSWFRRQSPRRRVALAAVPVALLALGAWRWTAAATADGVSVAWSGAPRCTGATVRIPRNPSRPPVIQARRGMQCTITVMVSNRSRFDVRLESAVATYLGSSGGAVVKADPPAKSLGPDDLHAYYALDRSLPAGDVTRFQIGLTFREDGCSGARTTLLHWPYVTVRAFRMSFDRASADDFSFIQRGPSQGCTALEN